MSLHSTVAKKSKRAATGSRETEHKQTGHSTPGRHCGDSSLKASLTASAVWAARATQVPLSFQSLSSSPRFYSRSYLTEDTGSEASFSDTGTHNASSIACLFALG